MVAGAHGRGRVVGDHRGPAVQRRQRRRAPAASSGSASWRAAPPRPPAGGAATPSRHSARPPRRAPASPAHASRSPASASQAPDQASCSSAGRPAPAREARSSSEANGPPASRAATSAATSSARTPEHVAQAEPHRRGRLAVLRPGASTTEHPTPLALTSGGSTRDPAPLGLVDQRVGRVEAHRLLVEQRAQELRPVVLAQPGRLVGQQAEGRAVGLGEAEPREAHDHRPHPLGAAPRRRRRAGPSRPATKRSWKARIAASERLRDIARRSPSASPGEKPANARAASMTWSWKMIVPSVSRRTGSSDGWS